MSKYEEIYDIFYSGQITFTVDKQVIQDIVFLLNEKYLVLEKIDVATKEEYFKAIEEIDSLSPDSMLAGGGGNTHIALKLLASQYLKNSRNMTCAYEHSFCGYFPDVLSNDKKTAIECGHTQNPEKIFKYFRHGNVKECIQIPYPDEKDTLILGYRFMPSKDFNEFYDFWETKRHADVKSVITNPLAVYLSQITD